MKRFIAGVASVALAVALLGNAPPVFAVTDTIEGVAASVSWGSATQNGAEKRVLFTTGSCASGFNVTTCMSYKSDTPMLVNIGITNLCNQAPYGPFTDTTCALGTGNDLDVIPLANMLWAAQSNTRTSAGSNLTSQCAAITQPTMFTASPSGTNVGAVPVAFEKLCSNNSPMGANTFWVKNLYLAVKVPAGKHSGVYTATITFGITH